MLDGLFCLTIPFIPPAGTLVQAAGCARPCPFETIAESIGKEVVITEPGIRASCAGDIIQRNEEEIGAFEGFQNGLSVWFSISISTQSIT